ncbi:MAG: hypothetical protein ABIB72_03315 [Candidatus Falkowbacteria bacterium]
MPKRRPKKLKIRVEKKKKINKVDGGVILKNKTDEDAEKEKQLLMRVGVACFMIVFFVAWFFNLKYQFKINSNNNSKSSFNWEQTKAELDKAMSQVKQGINEIKQIQATKEQNTLPHEPELTAEQIDLLKGKLMNEVATSTTASSTKK